VVDGDGVTGSVVGFTDVVAGFTDVVAGSCGLWEWVTPFTGEA
jgi:hypothetical protein